jgi:hypothetical protein
MVTVTIEIAAQVQRSSFGPANASHEQLFHYDPDDVSGWIFSWFKNGTNTWQGRCLYPAVDLRVYRTTLACFARRGMMDRRTRWFLLQNSEMKTTFLITASARYV